MIPHAMPMPGNTYGTGNTYILDWRKYPKKGMHTLKKKEKKNYMTTQMTNHNNNTQKNNK